MSSSSYRPHSVVGEPHGHMVLPDRLNRGGGVLCQWRCNLLVTESKKEVGANSEEVK